MKQSAKVVSHVAVAKFLKQGMFAPNVIYSYKRRRAPCHHVPPVRAGDERLISKRYTS